jgi:phosphate transport system protein
MATRQFEEELDNLNNALKEMAALVAQSIHRSVLSLLEKNEDYAEEVLRDEGRIDQLEIQIDDMVTSLIAREAPVARDMRFAVVAIKINTDLERMGDLAVGIVERSLAVIRHPEIPTDGLINEIANVVESMVLTSLESFVQRDPKIARSVIDSDDSVDKLRNRVAKQMIEQIKADPSIADRAVDYILIARRLERIADHATNIAQDVIFMVKGIDVRHGAAEYA